MKARAMKTVSRSLERFWFEPQSVATLVFVRIAFGIVAFLWTLSLAPDLMNFFSRSGFVPAQPSNRFWLGVLSPAAPDWLVYVVFVVTLIAAACLIVGFRTRLAAVLVFVGVLSFERRNPFMFNAGDVLVRNLAFYLMLAPSGVALSIDAWRRGRATFWEFAKRAPWALRLIQVQLSVVYVATVWAKVRGNDWNDGTAVSYALRLHDLARIGSPDWFATSEVVSNLLTFGTLAVEASLAILIWNRKARPWVLGAGLLMHGMIALNIMVGFFTMAILVAYLAFVPPETLERLTSRLRARAARSRSGRIRAVAGFLETPHEHDRLSPATR